MGVLLSAVAGRGAELLCAPSASGCVTTWLVAGPWKFLRDEGLDEDFLQAAGGEAAAQPCEGPTWKVAVLPDNVMNFKERCGPSGRSAFYLAATLVAKRDVDLTLSVTHTGQARAWLDGKSVARSDRDPFALGPSTFDRQLSLKADERARCLLKLGSEGRHLQFFVRLTAGRRAASADDVVVALPFAPDAKPDPAAYVLPALSLSLGRQEFVEPGREAKVAFGVAGGYPLCEGKVGAAIAVHDAKGQAVATLDAPPAPLDRLAAAPAVLPWTPPAAGGSAFFRLVATPAYEGRKLEAFAKTVYCPKNIGQWTTDLRDRLLESAADHKFSRDDLAHVLLKIEKASLLQQGFAEKASAADEVFRELETATESLLRLEGGKGLPPLGPGVHEAAYLAEQDDSPQPYYLHVPQAAASGKPLPAIVYLHGYAPWLDKTNWHELSYNLADLAEARGYAIICPFARSNTDFQGIGEADVLHVLRLAQQKVKLDPDRIFLLGYSMGGMGAYTVAAHYPDLWAGVVVMCGRADYYLWKGLDPDKVEPFKRHLLDMEFGWPLARNFLHVPVIAYQGSADILIKPQQAYRMVDRLKGLGSDAELVRLDGESHWIADPTFSNPRAFDWMDRRRRVAAPKAVRFKTYTLLYNRAYWLTIEAFQRWGEPAEVDAELKPGNTIEITATNAARLTLRPPAELCKPAEPFQIVLGGKPTESKPDAKGELVVDLAPLKPSPLRKTPALCGPIKDAFNRRFLLVYGTKGDEEATERNRALARRTQKEWYAFAKGFRQTTRDTDVSDAEIARSNLILFGTPKTNAILARIADKLPIRFTEGGYEVLGRAYKATETTGLVFIYPNPLAPDRYVVVCDGLAYGEKLGENHKLDLLPDFIIYCGDPDYDDTNAYYCAGFFDGAWQLDPKLTWTSDGTPRPKP